MKAKQRCYFLLPNYPPYVQLQPLYQYSIPETIQRRKFYLRGILSTVKVTVSSMLKISSSIEFVTTCAPIIFFGQFSRYETHVIICIMMLIKWRRRIFKIVKIVIGI
jgi:hypothetical protein